MTDVIRMGRRSRAKSNMNSHSHHSELADVVSYRTAIRET